MIFYFIAALWLVGCQSATDREGNTYPTATIGDQVWMGQNLNVATFRNGDPIPEVQSADEWLKAGENGQPAWCYYNNDPSSGEKFGKLYNWFAVVDPRGLAPEGWRIPTDDDWYALAKAVGGPQNAGLKLKSKKWWRGNGNGTDDYGFAALPAGGRGEISGFTAQGAVAVFWSSTPESNTFARYRVLHATRKGIFPETDFKSSGFSVRCLEE